MSDWITDRPPTEADGDCDGDVFLHDQTSDGGVYVHWAYVRDGAPWRHSRHGKTPALATGGRSILAGLQQEESLFKAAIARQNNCGPAPQQPKGEPVDAEFTPPAAEIPGPIRSGVASFYVVVASDDSGRGSGGNPIIWETQIPEGSSLQAVLQQQSRVGHRYGTTFIAECRIIPELTRS